MKKLLLTLGLALAGGALSLAAQAEGKPYMTWIELGAGKPQAFGYLTELYDDSLALFPSLRADARPQRYPIDQIESLALRRKGRVANGALIGSGLGFAVGFVLGAVLHEENPDCSILCPDPVLTGFLVGALGGIPLGALTGITLASPKITIPIGKSRRRYEEERVRLEAYRWTRRQ